MSSHKAGWLLALLVLAAGCGSAASTTVVRTAQVTTADAPAIVTAATTTTTTTTTTTATTRARDHARPPFAVGKLVVRFTDGNRPLVTVIRYPADRAAAPFPLVIFGHGFAVTPAPYAGLLRAWAAAGYVVAAPIFPFENANSPGGPDESDLVNQPPDMSAVITGMLAASARRHGIISRLIAPRAIAVSGQSDGGDTALAVAYNVHYLDRRVRAAVILSGAEIPGTSGWRFPPGGAALMATQGTADTINPPSMTSTFFDAASAPKYLLRMFDAPHLGPYTSEQPQLRIVERVTIAFLDRYLKGSAAAERRISTHGDVPGVAAVTAVR